MPQRLLLETLQDSARLNVPAVLNGLHQNSMIATADKINTLSQVIPDLQMQIDPTAFERFDIHQVPALVLENNGCFDVIYGHLSLQEGLNRLIRHGTCGVTNEMIKETRHA
jgi:conjugal transfer pilus assembly protein TrbC